jgi:hypothetical protein
LPRKKSTRKNVRAQKRKPRVSGHQPSAAAPPALIARTIGEAAAHLGVSLRTLAAWCTEPGFPGQPGGPGRQDGNFPIAAIRTWHLAMHGGSRSREEDAETLAARRLKTLIEVDQAQVDLEKDLGTIGDAEAWADFCRRVVAAAKAQLEELPDRVNARLPAKLPAATRALVRKVIGESIVDVLNTIAELIAGDSDDAEDLNDDSEDLADDADEE